MENTKEGVNFVQQGETVACGHCDARFAKGMANVEKAMPEYKCECRCHSNEDKNGRYLYEPEVKEIYPGNTKEEWEVDFDEKFTTKDHAYGGKAVEKDWNGDLTQKWEAGTIKAWIKSLLSKEKARIREEIERKAFVYYFPVTGKGAKIISLEDIKEILK